MQCLKEVPTLVTWLSTFLFGEFFHATIFSVAIEMGPKLEVPYIRPNFQICTQNLLWTMGFLHFDPFWVLKFPRIFRWILPGVVHWGVLFGPVPGHFGAGHWTIGPARKCHAALAGPAGGGGRGRGAGLAFFAWRNQKNNGSNQQKMVI